MDGQQKVYIADFYDNNSKTIYEIKPSTEKVKNKNKAKFAYAESYCKNKNINYKIIDESYFLDKLQDEKTMSDINRSMDQKDMKNFLKGIKFDSRWTKS